MSTQEIILAVGPIGTMFLLAFIAVWILVELRVALAFLASLIGLAILAGGIAFFWIWIVGVVV